jgi:hypothetical protein
LAQSAGGRWLIALYYRHSDRIQDILTAQPAMRKAAAKLLKAVVAAMEMLAEE